MQLSLTFLGALKIPLWRGGKVVLAEGFVQADLKWLFYILCDAKVHLFLFFFFPLVEINVLPELVRNLQTMTLLLKTQSRTGGWWNPATPFGPCVLFFSMLADCVEQKRNSEKKQRIVL